MIDPKHALTVGEAHSPAHRERDRRQRKSRPLAGFLAGGLLLITAFAPAPAATPTHGEPGMDRVAYTTAVSSEQTHHPREKTYMKRKWGIEVVFVRQSSAGYMLEFRYKVIDADKAAPLFTRQTKPILTDVKTGAKMIVPTPAKTGALRNSNMPIEGRTYWMFFANPGKLVQPGDKVNIAIGKFQADGLVVQ